MKGISHRLSFRPKARIIRTIGDKLISGPEAAVIELIKNSHDADASFVKITFVPPLSSGSGAIIVHDDGHGMTFDDVREKWMEPATADKGQRLFSPGGRRLLGSKGIGRFATARLGQFLAMESTATLNKTEALFAHNETTRIPRIDWSMFEAQEYLDSIGFDANIYSSESSTGTTLTISALRDAWTPDRIQKLHYELRRLISPIEDPNKAPFDILLDFSQCTEDACGLDWVRTLTAIQSGTERNGQVLVRPFPLLEASDYVVDGIFDESGHFEGSMQLNRGEIQKVDLSWTLPPSNEIGNVSCGVVLLRFYIFDRETDAVRATAERAGFGGLSVKETRKMLDNVAGVAIYREGFRIRPYGDIGNDWLSLDSKRVQNPSMRVGRNQIAGIITIESEENSGLVERSSREGLEENDYFFRLASLISDFLAEVVEPRRRVYREASGFEKPERPDILRAYEQAKFGWIEELLQKLPERERQRASAIARHESAELTKQIGELETLQMKLQAQVTVGQIIGEVRHQGINPVAYIKQQAIWLRKFTDRIFGQVSDENQIKKDYSVSVSGIRSNAERLQNLFELLKPLSGARRGAPKVFSILHSIDEILNLLRGKMESFGILASVESDGDGGGEVIGYEEDVYQALVNLLDNAIFWLSHHRVEAPQIIVRITHHKDNVSCAICDNGRGIPDVFENQIFNVGFSLKPQGTGLGLNMAREALHRSNGNLEFVRSDQGATFLMVLPRGKVIEAPALFNS